MTQGSLPPWAYHTGLRMHYTSTITYYTMLQRAYAFIIMLNCVCLILHDPLPTDPLGVV
jgi:hypothetical protein